MKYKRYKKIGLWVAITLLTGTTLCPWEPSLAATAATIPNTQLPQGGNFVGQNQGQIKQNDQNHTTTIVQNNKNGVITWDSFNVGANATVEFQGVKDFNTLNYDKSGTMSQIHGKINSYEKGTNNVTGNIYIVNPNGVQIGKSAQINVGSLYVSNYKLDDNTLQNIGKSNDMAGALQNQNTARTNAELMSLGNINAKNVTFSGNRIVLDVDHIKNGNDTANITVQSDNKDIVLGSTDGTAKNVTVKGETNTNQYAYTWIKNVNDLQHMDLGKNYALNTSIDAIATKDWKDANTDTAAKGFKSIGDDTNAFTGKFDGLGFSIFGLTINRDTTDNTGIFGSTNGATVKNVDLIGGTVTGQNNTGALIGHAVNTTVSNIKNTINVTGQKAVGGVIGNGEKTNLSDNFNNAIIKGTDGVGGIAGQLADGSVTGTSYNMGSISGDHYVGGIVGDGTNVTIGNDATGFQMYNGLNITAQSSVGGIAGRVTGKSTIQNVANEGVITATGAAKGTLTYGKANINSNAYGQDNLETNAANAGGIVGETGGSAAGTDKIEITNVSNSGAVQSVTDKDLYKDTNKAQKFEGYYAGNIGGIVGYAKNTTITQATNNQANISGSHNIGGIVGHLDTQSKISHATNSGTITATGSVNDDVVANMTDPGIGTQPLVNVGGVAGYVSGQSTIASSGNTGNVIADKKNNGLVLLGTGGIAGRIDELGNEVGTETKVHEALQNDASKATIYDSYNTGGITGDRAVGGIAGSIYNGSIANSYNEGRVITIGGATGGSIGGIVGDARGNTGEQKGSVLYNVYNKGVIGDKSFTNGGQNVGGIVGHLAGIIDGSYNTGEIYNNFFLVGGLVGWLPQGSIYHSFNSGNITVNNKRAVNIKNTTTAVGGIVGAVEGKGGNTITLQDVYNIGLIRAGQDNKTATLGVAGIIGAIHYNHKTARPATINLDHVYSLGTIYRLNDDTGTRWNTGYILGASTTDTGLGSQKVAVNFDNVYYITLEGTGTPFETNNTNTAASGNVLLGGNYKDKAHKIAFKDRYKLSSWNQGGENFFDGDTDITDNKGRDNTTVGADWRMYANEALPTLNFFRPKGMDDWFKTNTDVEKQALLQGVDINSVRFGNAVNPYLTFANAKDNSLTIDASKFHFGTRDGIVTDKGLTITNFTYHDVDEDSPIAYNGTLLAQKGALNIGGQDDLAFGSASRLYGDSVKIQNTNGTVTLNGQVQALGQDATDTDSGNITIEADNISVTGKLKGSDTTDAAAPIPGVSQAFKTALIATVTDDVVKNFTTALPTQDDAYGTANFTSNKNGNISITGTNVEVLYGGQGAGTVSAGGSLAVTGTDTAYVDSDIAGVKGNVDVKSDNQATLDVSNVSNKDFFTNHKDADNSHINVKGTDSVLAFDAWDKTKGTNGAYNLDNEKLKALLQNGTIDKAKLHLWVDSGEALKDIATNTTTDTNNKGLLDYNFALKQDIDLSGLQNYQSIGSNGIAYTGQFNGRGYSLVGLNLADTGKNNSNLGIFGTIGQGGSVKNLTLHNINVNSTGTGNNLGLLAGTNSGTVDNVTVWGGTAAGKGNIGGFVGVNSGTGSISNVEGNSVVNSWSADQAQGDVVGGLVGQNDGTVEMSNANSGLTNSGNGSQGYAKAMGGIVGLNNKDVKNVTNRGVTAGIYEVVNPNNTAQQKVTYTGNQIGGIVGKNNGTVDGAYNEAVVSGGTDVGGVIGNNSANGKLNNAANAMAITGSGQNTGGIIGTNAGSASSGRNNGVINGNENVGGLVGTNGQDATLENLNNDDSANITGNKYVGGIAGANSGTIDAKGSTLQNTGVITGQQYVGGVAGHNTQSGKILNTVSNIVLNVKDENATGNDAAQYFGGVVGSNAGTIQGGLNTGDIHADGASYVGGIIGQNTGTLESVTNTDGTSEGIGNDGTVSGKNFVGGIIGKNDQSLSKVTIKNTGAVTATDGGAGGIIGENSGTWDNVTMENTDSGTVVGSGTDANGGTGGIAGLNTGNVTNSTLKNSGNVKNETGVNVGSIFGNSSGTISYSSLINTAEGKVSGNENVGGIIGYNTGAVTGGRDTADTYYKNQLINNGIVVGGTVDDDGTIKVETQSQNIGGLIGNNAQSGTLTAGYNTGTVHGGTNVGGVVGTNTGTVSQVFSTLADGKSVQGTTNVGGVVGNNENGSTLKDSYAIDSFTTGTNAGNVVGTNGGTVQNVYSQSNTGKLIGDGTGTITNSISYSKVDSNKQGITVLGDVKDQKDSTKYTNFDFTNTWKNYDGNSNPMLKIFLTKAVIKDTDGNEVKLTDLKYNGKTQSLAVKSIEEQGQKKVALYLHNDGQESNLDTLVGYVTVQDDTGVHNLNDFLNTEIEKGDKNLLQGTSARNAGETLSLWSQQINTNGTDNNPNNLGYDIDVSGTLGKAQLIVSTGDVTRTYGDTTITNGTYFKSITGWVGDDATKDGQTVDHSNDFMFTMTDDGGLVEHDGVANSRTNDVKEDYTWNGTVTLNKDDLKNNYDLVFNGTTSTTAGSVDVSGKSIVNKAKLTVTGSDVYRDYGNKEFKNNSGYNITINGWKYDDGNQFTFDKNQVTDGALSTDLNRTTNDYKEGGYDWSGTFKLTGTAVTNYDLTFEQNGTTTNGTHGSVTVGGKSYIDKVDLHIQADNQLIKKGEKPNYTGSINGLTNGDEKKFTFKYGIEDPSQEDIVGVHSGIIGLVHDGNQFIVLGNTKDNIDALAKYLGINAGNYNFDLTPGTLTVKDIYKPTTPDSHWDWLYKDYPWDKIKNFRERRAELHYVDGGVFIEQ